MSRVNKLKLLPIVIKEFAWTVWIHARMYVAPNYFRKKELRNSGKEA